MEKYGDFLNQKDAEITDRVIYLIEDEENKGIALNHKRKWAIQTKTVGRIRLGGGRERHPGNLADQKKPRGLNPLREDKNQLKLSEQGRGSVLGSS